MKFLYAIPALALAVLVVILAQLASLQYEGPPHVELMLEGGLPATFYLPSEAMEGPTSRWGFGEPAEGDGPPALILVHGFAMDRVSLSSMARSVAEAGYAVLAIDVRGHGENRNAFTAGRGTDAMALEDIGVAVDFLRTSPHVDGNRIVVGGHSMGAGASLVYGGSDAGLDGLILISGGWGLRGPHRPANALFMAAAGDPANVRQRMAELASELAGVEALDLGTTAGDFSRGTGVRVVTIPGTGHIDVVQSDGAIGEIVGWMDAIYGTQRAAPARMVDARRDVAALGFLALLFVFPGIGGLVGRLSPHVTERPATGVLGRLLVFGGVLLVTLPLVAVGEPGALVNFSVGDHVVAQLFYVGVIFLTASAWFGKQSGFTGRVGRWDHVLLAAAIGMLVIYALQVPLFATQHRMSLTPERTLLGILTAFALVPFTLSVNMLLRRGSAWVSTLMVLLGRAIIVIVLGVGVVTEMLPGVIALMLPLLAGFFILFELVAVPIYVSARNVVTIAVLEALWLAWIFAAVLPVYI